MHLPGAQCPLPVLCSQVNLSPFCASAEKTTSSQVNLSSCPFNLKVPPCSSFIHRVSCSLLQRKPEEEADLTEKVSSLCIWRYPILISGSLRDFVPYYTIYKIYTTTTITTATTILLYINYVICQTHFFSDGERASFHRTALRL